MSSYQNWWVEIIPVSGCVTKHDRKQFGDILCLGRREKTHRKFFGEKKRAQQWLSGFDKKLDKNYVCYLFTDKQYEMASPSDGYKIRYTQKQLSEPYYL